MQVAAGKGEAKPVTFDFIDFGVERGRESNDYSWLPLSAKLDVLKGGNDNED